MANTLVGLSRIAAMGIIFLAGWAADRFGPRRTLGGIFLSCGIATVFVGLLHGWWIFPPLFLQAGLSSAFFPAGLAALSRIGPPQLTNLAVSLTLAGAYIVATGAIPTGIGFLGDQGLFSLGFVLVGLLLIGCIILLKYLRFHQER